MGSAEFRLHSSIRGWFMKRGTAARAAGRTPLAVQLEQGFLFAAGDAWEQRLHFEGLRVAGLRVGP
jgi:hypothetical protein